MVTITDGFIVESKAVSIDGDYKPCRETLLKKSRGRIHDALARTDMKLMPDFDVDRITRSIQKRSNGSPILR